MTDRVEIEVGANTAPARAEFDKLGTDVGKSGETVKKSFDRAADAVDAFGVKAETGSKGMVLAAAKAKLAVEALEREIDQLKLKGEDTSGPVAALNKLKAAYDANVVAAGRARASAADVADQLKGATARAGEFQGQVTSLADAMAVKFPAAADAIVGVVSALATFKLAFSETRQFVSFVRDQFGVDIDQFVKDSVTGWVMLYDQLIEKTPEVVKEQQQLDNMIKILDAHGIEHGKTVEDVTAAYGRLGNALRAATSDVQDADAAYKVFAEKAAGASVDKLNERIHALLSTVSAFHGDFAALQKSPIFEAFAKEVADVDAILSKFGSTLQGTLEGDALNEFRANVETFGDEVKGKLGSALDEFTKKTVDASKGQRDLAVALRETSKAADDQVASLKKAADQADAAADKARERFNKARDKVEPGGSPTKDVQSDLAKLNSRIEELNSQTFLTPEQFNELDALKKQAFELSSQVSLLGQAQVGTAESGSKLADAEQEVSDAFDDYAQKTREAYERTRDLNEAHFEAEKNAVIAERGFNSTAVAVKTLADGTRVMTNTYNEADEAIRRTSDGTDLVAESARRAKSRLDDTGKSVAELAKQADKAVQPAADLKEAVASLGDEGAEGIRTLKSEALGYEEVVDRLIQKHGTLNQLLADMGNA